MKGKKGIDVQWVGSILEIKLSQKETLEFILLITWDVKNKGEKKRRTNTDKALWRGRTTELSPVSLDFRGKKRGEEIIPIVGDRIKPGERLRPHVKVLPYLEKVRERNPRKKEGALNTNT